MVLVTYVVPSSASEYVLAIGSMVCTICMDSGVPDKCDHQGAITLHASLMLTCIILP